MRRTTYTHLVEVSDGAVMRKVGLEQAGPVSPRGPVLVGLAGEGGGVSDRDDQHLHADEQVLYPLLDVVRRPPAHLVDQVHLHQSGDHDALHKFVCTRDKPRWILGVLGVREGRTQLPDSSCLGPFRRKGQAPARPSSCWCRRRAHGGSHEGERPSFACIPDVERHEHRVRTARSCQVGYHFNVAPIPRPQKTVRVDSYENILYLCKNAAQQLPAM